MLKHRLIFGTLMTVVFTGIVLFDGRLDGLIGNAETGGIKGSLFALIVALIVTGAQVEFARLVSKKDIRIFLPVTIPVSIFLSLSWYFSQFFNFTIQAYLLSVLAFTILGLFAYQYYRRGTRMVVVNCGASLFSIIYLGVLSAFIVALRVECGLWELLMFMFVVKTADIGAYTAGRLFGKRKFSPVISPNKSWEGMAGAVITAVIVALLFSKTYVIMNPWLAVLFGICFAFIGQLSDLAESMIKRDAELKDSVDSGGVKVPGFGGILDVIDSPLGAGIFAYLFFMFVV